ncbi:MAG: class I SAM-dependent methyltransferase [Cohnella sp.]|nr:class I SAM-dependent methyltransferase [Cohnella sp.]
MIVTTSERPSEAMTEKAIRLAEELQVPYVPRLNRTIRGMYQNDSIEKIVVVGAKEVRLMQEGQKPFFYHPSMALVRLKRVRSGGVDTLLSVSGVASGDTVLDCTAGLCSDAVVFSYAVGDKGKVMAVEASRLLHLIVKEGLQAYETGLSDIDEAMRAVQPIVGRHQDLLPRMQDNSVDIVYFDPMFEKPVTASSSMLPLRSQAVSESLTKETVQEAVRIARKRIVLKDHRDSGQFERLGFRLARVSSSAVAYGVIDVD